jgi:hypothetical protein
MLAYADVCWLMPTYAIYTGLVASVLFLKESKQVAVAEEVRSLLLALLVQRTSEVYWLYWHFSSRNLSKWPSQRRYQVLVLALLVQKYKY